MGYSIGTVSKEMGVPASTLRYYDKVGLIPSLKRNDSGLRVFDDDDLAGLRLIECLKNAGLSIKEIKQYMDWCQEGDSTLEKHLNMFYERRRAVEQEMSELQDTLDTLNFKCWYYETSCAAGTTKVVENMSEDDMPPEMLKVQKRLHRTMNK